MTDDATTLWRYKCVAAPRKARRNRVHRTCEDALLSAMETALAEHAAEGWEYLRTDLVPMEARHGLFSGSVETHLGVMVFRRPADPDGIPPRAAIPSPRAAAAAAAPPRLGAARPD